MAFLLFSTAIGSTYGKAYSQLYSPTENSEELYLADDDKKLFSDVDYSLKLKAFKKYGTFAFYYKKTRLAIRASSSFFSFFSFCTTS